jgi:uncharacterized membrane protein
MTRAIVTILVYLGARATWERASANAYSGVTMIVAASISLVANVVMVFLCFATDCCGGEGARRSTEASARADDDITTARILVCVWLGTTLWASIRTFSWANDVICKLRTNQAKVERNDLAMQIDAATYGHSRARV